MTVRSWYTDKEGRKRPITAKKTSLAVPVRDPKRFSARTGKRYCHMCGLSCPEGRGSKNVRPVPKELVLYIQNPEYRWFCSQACSDAWRRKMGLAPIGKEVCPKCFYEKSRVFGCQNPRCEG